MATALEIIQDAALELGLVAPVSVFGSSDAQAQQFGALLNRTGKFLSRDRGWTVLQTVYIINIEAPIQTTGDTVTGSGVITNIPTTAGVTAGTYAVSGNGVTQASRVVSVDSGTQVTIDQPVTETATGAAVTFVKDTFPVPADFDRFINDTQWDRTNHWQLIGPDSPQMDEWHQSGIVTTGPRRHFRQLGRLPNVFRIWPPPSSDEVPATLAFEYVSTDWIVTNAGASANKITADSDEVLFDAHVMTLGLKAYFWMQKGFDWEPQWQLFTTSLDTRKAQDGGAKTLSLGRRNFPIFISPANVPDSGFGNQ